MRKAPRLEAEPPPEPASPQPPPLPPMARPEVPARPAVVTGVLLAVMAAAAVLTWVDEGDDVLFDGALYPGAAGAGEWYRFLTSMFLHANVAHLALNGMSLWLFGGLAERAFGVWRYIVLFLAAGVAGNALFVVLSPPNVAAVGASGALFGVMGALAVTLRGERRNSVYLLLGANVVLQFVLPDVAWEAHMGGLAAGVALGLLYRIPHRRSADRT